MAKYNKISIVSESSCVADDYIKYVESDTKLRILDEIKDIVFSDKYFIVKASIKDSKLCDFNKNDLYIKGELIIEELTFKNLCAIIHLIK